MIFVVKYVLGVLKVLGKRPFFGYISGFSVLLHSAICFRGNLMREIFAKVRITGVYHTNHSEIQ